MNETRLRSIAGVALLCQHFALILIVIVLAAIGRFEIKDEMFAILGIVTPLFAAHATAALRRLLQPLPVVDPSNVARVRPYLLLGVPTFFFVLIGGLLFWKAFGALGFDSLIKLVSLSEIMIGVYVGIVVESAFGPSERTPRQRKRILNSPLGPTTL